MRCLATFYFAGLVYIAAFGIGQGRVGVRLDQGPTPRRARAADSATSACILNNRATPGMTATPGRNALEERPDDMTFESGGQGLWSTVDDYLTFARMLLGDSDVPALLRAETRALTRSNQLTADQRAAARMFGQRIFAAGHGYGMGVATIDRC